MKITNTVFVLLIGCLFLLPGCQWQKEQANINSEQLSGTDCGDGALLKYDCWTSRMPADIYDKGDVTCTFLISCCGKDIGNGWQREYPKMTGLRGFVDNGSVISKASCKDLPALGDMDGDDVANADDDTPVVNGKKPWEEKNTN